MLCEVDAWSEQNSALLAKLGVSSIRDLWFYLPIRYVDRTNSDLDSPCGSVVTVLVKVAMHFPPRTRRMPYRVLCKTKDQCLTLVFFHYSARHLKSALQVDSSVVVSGKLSVDKSMVHPDYIESADKFNQVSVLEPIYRTVKGLSARTLRRLIVESLAFVEDVEEWVDAKTLAQFCWPSWKDSISAIHTSGDQQLIKAACERLAFDELSSYLLKIEQLRKALKGDSGIKVAGKGDLRATIAARLGFTFTQGQREALEVIYADQASGSRMVRLIQGDVGCGKTLVALMAILNAIECGYQAVCMAPTEVLANQHYQFFSDCLAGHATVAMITGKVTNRSSILSGIAAGSIDILIGTHALFGDKICFKNLALAVIDEQHRFGVEQRSKLIGKGENADVLMMSATPIPRSLNMIAYGELDTILIRDKPIGRKKIQTLVYGSDKLDDLVTRIGESRQKVYWVCPLVEESESSGVTDVNTRYQHLVKVFGLHRVGLIHGKVSEAEKGRVISRFRASQDMILVATSIIEVGVDVKDASVVIIENAERFGLAQLHQLRGRVGRGDLQSYCILLYDSLSPISCSRLKTLKECDDGFEIAERDLAFRGGGDLVGVKQSGWPKFWFFDPLKHNHLLRLVDVAKTLPDKHFERLAKVFARDSLPPIG